MEFPHGKPVLNSTTDTRRNTVFLGSSPQPRGAGQGVEGRHGATPRRLLAKGGQGNTPRKVSAGDGSFPRLRSQQTPHAQGSRLPHAAPTPRRCRQGDPRHSQLSAPGRVDAASVGRRLWGVPRTATDFAELSDGDGGPRCPGKGKLSRPRPRRRRRQPRSRPLAPAACRPPPVTWLQGACAAVT